MKHLNSPSFQSSFYAEALAEAKSQGRESLHLDDPSHEKNGEGKDTSGDVAEKPLSCDDNLDESTPEVSTDNSTARDATNELLPSEADADHEPDSQSDIEAKEASQEQGSNEAKVDGEDDDASVFSDQDIEDFEQEYEDSHEFERLGIGSRYEIEQWFFHVRQAERLWASNERENDQRWQELLAEMERFFLLEPIAFEAWKLVFVQYNRESWPPFLFAASYGLTSLAELLLRRGAKVMDLSMEGYSALHIASEAPNRLEMLRLLLSNGGDPNYEGKVIPPFHEWLISDPELECVEALLGSNASCTLANGIDDHWTALHYFAQFGTEITVLRLLLDNAMNNENHADINVRDGDGETPLHKLMSRLEIPLDLLQEFLAQGAEVNVEDKASERPLYEAARWGENEAVELIISLVTDVDDDNQWGRTALHGAAWAGQKETVELLLKHGANAKYKDKHDRTALLFACLPPGYRFARDDGHRSTAELLVETQIRSGDTFQEINACSKSGRTVLREAAGRGFTQVVASLLKYMTPEDKAWLSKRDDGKGRSPLHSAVAHGRTGVIVLLLEYGADPSLRDGQDGTGMTSLELSLDKWTMVDSQHYETAVICLMDVCMSEAKENKLLLTTAAIRGSITILKKLASAGVNLNLPDIYGWTPGQLASQFGHLEAEAFIRKSLANKALRPTQWTLKDSPKNTILGEDGRRVEHEGDLRHSILANHPVPAGLSYYYEINILDVETGEPKGKYNGGFWPRKLTVHVRYHNEGRRENGRGRHWILHRRCKMD